MSLTRWKGWLGRVSIVCWHICKLETRKCSIAKDPDTYIVDNFNSLSEKSFEFAENFGVGKFKGALEGSGQKDTHQEAMGYEIVAPFTNIYCSAAQSAYWFERQTQYNL